MVTFVYLDRMTLILIISHHAMGYLPVYKNIIDYHFLLLIPLIPLLLLLGHVVYRHRIKACHSAANRKPL